MKNVNKNIIRHASFAAFVTFAALAALLIALSFAACDNGMTGSGEPGTFTISVGRAITGGTDGTWNGATIADLYHTIWLFDGAGVQKLLIENKRNETISYSVPAGTYEVYVEAWTGQGRTGDLKAIGYALDVAIKSGTNNPIPITMQQPFVFEEAPGLSENGTVAVGTELTANAEKNEDDNRDVSFTWQWYRDGVAISGATSNKYKADEAGTYTVTVSARGYKSETSAEVTVADLPVLPGDITIDQTTAEVGTELSASYSGDDTDVTYQWYRDGVAIPGATNETFIPQQEGSYTVTVSASGYLSKTSAAVTVTPKTLTGDITLTADTGYVGAVLTADYNGDETVTYHWFMNEAPIAGVTDTTHTATAAGSYTVTVRSMGYTSKTSLPVTITPLPVPEAGDFDIGNLSQTAESVTAVTITPKTGKSGGTITRFYNGSEAIPQAAGTYAVTFDVAAATGWAAANGLQAGTLTVNAITLTGITVTTQPTKTVYAIDETFSPAGMVVTAHYSNATTAVVPSGTGGYTSSPTTAFTTTGSHTITISYQGHTATFTVTVSTFTPAIPDGATVIYVAATEGGGGRADSKTWDQAVSRIDEGLETNFAIIVIQNISIAGAGTSIDDYTFHNGAPELNLYLAGQTGKEIISLNTGNTGHLLSFTFTQNVIMDGLTLKGHGSNEYGLVSIWGSFTMNGGGISGNTGGAVLIYANGTFTMNGGEISGNIATTSNNSVVSASSGGKIIMTGGRISGNTGSRIVYATGNDADDSIFTMSGGVISGNTATNFNGEGVVYLSGVNTMTGGEISDNSSTGVYVVGGTFTMSGNAKVSGNVSNRDGGGVLVAGGTFTMSGNAKVSGNTAKGTTGTIPGGGGVYVDGGTFNMTGGEVSDNTTDKCGGGVYVNGGTFTMSGNAKVSGNTAKGTDTNNLYNGGGGVYVDGGTFNMTGGEVSNNTAEAAGSSVFVYGGGVFVDNSSDSKFYISNGTIYGTGEDDLSNTAIYGAALYKGANGTAQRGTFSGGTWSNLVNFNSTENNTIKVQNGNIVP